MGVNQDPNVLTGSGYMKTAISDLGTVDKIDLSFLETHGADQLALRSEVVTKSVFTTTSAGTILNLSAFDLTSSTATSGLGDRTDVLTSNLLEVSNNNATKTSAAIVGVGGVGGSSSAAFVNVSFDSLFDPLTNTY
jgi:hypothetical protein